MTEARWLKGTLTGTCVGKPTRKRGGSGLARWYKLELVEAVLSDWAAVAGPPPTAPTGEAPFCQARLEDARLRTRTPGGTDEALALRDLSVWDWKMRDQREAGGESRCTLSGTVYAQIVDGTRRPVLPEGADRLGGWGCLTVLAGLLVASWLWWSCGPFTCGLWTAVVLTSWWTQRMRTRRRTPPSLGWKIVQGILGFALILGGVGLVLGMADPARASTCSSSAGLAVVGAVAGVVGASLLAVSWPLPWIWTLWTMVVVLWCGRTGTDCAGLWLKEAQEIVRGVSPRQGPELIQRMTGGAETGLDATGRARADRGAEGGDTGSGESGSGESGSGGTGSDGTGSDGTGSSGNTGSGNTGSGNTGSGGTGSGGTESGGTGSGGTGSGGTGSDGTGSDGTGSDDTGSGGMGSGNTGSGNTGSGNTGSGGTGSGNTGSGGTGSGGTGSDGTGSGGTGSGELLPGEASPEAQAEPRMSVEAALNDPKPFMDGSARVTLSGDLLFQFDEDRLKPDADARLRQLAQLLRLNPAQRVLLEGHADTIGGDQYNQELSERRAQAVRTWLVEQAHINPLQIDTVGFGSVRPLVPASRGPAAQQANRRVEVRVLSPGP